MLEQREDPDGLPADVLAERAARIRLDRPGAPWLRVLLAADEAANAMPGAEGDSHGD
jgi:hypothetical protein